MIQQLETAQEWARREFGSAQLGDKRRTNRLVQVASRAANDPDGKVTKVFAGAPAALEGAYRFLGSSLFETDAISQSMHQATALRSKGAPFMYVPIDGSSLQITDWKDARRLGVIGTRLKDARGLKVMTAIGVHPNGTPLGIVGQKFWVRSKKRCRKLAQKRRLKSKETKYWLEVMDDAERALEQAGVDTRLWYQMDREGDFWQAHRRVGSGKHWFTVRSKADRRLKGGGYLSTALDEADIAGCFELKVPGNRLRKPRTAWMELRFARVTLDMKDAWTSEAHTASMTVVNAVEVGTNLDGAPPLHWRLLTNWTVETAQDAWQVVFGYSQRWRVEEFHKTWKSGACNAEDTQLGNASAIIRWSTILASVAMRIERLKYLARNEPDVPASVELTREEIDAVIVLRKPKGFKPGDTPTIGQVVQWVAEMGGYTGKSSGGPPGSIVIGRGLEKIQIVLDALRNLGEM